MASGSTTEWSQLIELGPKQSDYRTDPAAGHLWSSLGLLNSRYLSGGDHYKYTAAGPLVAGSEAGLIADSGDITFSSINVTRGKGVGLYSATNEINEDSLVPAALVEQARFAVASYKDDVADAVLSAGLSGNTVANAAAISIADLMAEVAELPTYDASPVILCSNRVKANLHSEVLVAGGHVEHGMIAGLPVLPFEPSGFADASGDSLLYVGYPDLAALGVVVDRLTISGQALGVSGAINDMISIVVTSQHAALVRDASYMRRISVA